MRPMSGRSREDDFELQDTLLEHGPHLDDQLTEKTGSRGLYQRLSDGLFNFSSVLRPDTYRKLSFPHLLTLLLPQPFRPGSVKPGKLRPTAYLDALRGYAAIAVVNHHFYWQSHVLSLPFISLVRTGRAMVDVFFIISGYVLSHKLLRLAREGKEQDLLRTLASSTFRRYLRLYLSAGFGAFLSMLTITLGLCRHPVSPKLGVYAQILDFIDDMLHFSNPYAVVTGYYKQGEAVNSRYHPYLWTIPAEFRGSMVVFLFCASCYRLSVTNRRIVCWLMILLGFIWNAVYVSLFMFGAFLADCSIFRPQSPADLATPPHSEKRTLIITAVMFVTGTYLFDQPSHLGAFGQQPWATLSRAIPYWWPDWKEDREHFWLSIAAALVVAAFDKNMYLRRPLEYTFSQYIGKLSFGIYIMQLMVVRTLWDGPMSDLRSYGGGSTWLYAFTYFALMAMLLWAADMFMYADNQFIALGRWLEEATFL